MKFKFSGIKNHRNKKYKIKKPAIFLLLLSGILIAAVLAELFLRFFLTLPLEKEYLRFSCNNYKKLKAADCNPDLFWSPVEEFKNVLYPIKKPKNTFRIICIGDSITQGDAQKNGLLPREETYVYKLEKLLKKEIKQKKVECINAGSGGYSSLQGLRYLKQLCKYQPDLVISWFGINDCFYGLFYSDKEQKVIGSNVNTTKAIWQKSKLYLLFKNFFFIRNALKNPLVRVPPDDFYDNCRQMLQLADENNFTIVFVAPFQAELEKNKIVYLQEYADKLIELKCEYGVGVLSLANYIQGHALKKIYIDTCHLNDAGNKIIAEGMLSAVAEVVEE